MDLRMYRFEALGFISFFTFLLSIPVLRGGTWLATKADTDCEKFLQWPLIVIGAFLMLLSLAGLMCACCRDTWLLRLYMFSLVLVIILLFSFTVFTFVVTSKGCGYTIPGRGYKEYTLVDYSKWFLKRMENNSHWNKIKSCLQHSNTCNKLAHDSAGEVAEEFYKRNLTPTQSGCCKPPIFCNFAYVNATYWTSTTGNSTSTDMDCSRWSNVQDQLCYNCDSCKAGVLAKLKPHWLKIAIINSVMLFLLCWFCTAGYRTLKDDDDYDECLYCGG